MIIFRLLCVNFYPRSPCGERPGKVKVVEPGFVFLSTLSLRRATGGGHVINATAKNFYPRSPCGERLLNPLETLIILMISIHALLAESDFFLVFCYILNLYISIHALLAESDQFCGCQRGPGIAFLSTLSLRRATL